MPKQVPFPSLYRLGQLSLDGFIAWFACSLAFWVRFEGLVPDTHQTLGWILPIFAIFGRLSVQALFGVYQQVWRLFCPKDAWRLFYAASVYSLILLVTTRLLIPHFVPFDGIPLGVTVIDCSNCFVGMVALRCLRRWTYHHPRNAPPQARLGAEVQRVLLVGAGMAGCQVIQEARQHPQLQLKVVGFVDDDPTKLGRKVEGVTVFGNSSQLVDFARRLKVDEVLISMPSASAAQIRKLVALAQGTELKLKVLPGHGEILRDRHLTPQAREIQIQDILGRPEIRLDFQQKFTAKFPSARSQIYGSTILVTGAGGTIGSEICRQIAQIEPKHLLLLGRGENSIFNIEQELKHDFPKLRLTAIIADIRHQARIEEVFNTWQPEIIFHAAAHKHVPLMQSNPTESIENNALASARLAQLADKYAVKTFVLISTDKAVDPSSFMGLSKRLAELTVKASATNSQHTRFLVVRFGNVLGSRGSVVPIFKAQIAKRNPVTVTDRAMTRYFMTTPEASGLVIQSLAVGESGQTLILDMGEPVNIFDLAQQMIQLAGLIPETDIPIHITGLRPGEKLHESLISSTEKVVPTAHPKIMAVSSQLPSVEIFVNVINILSEATASSLPPEQLWLMAQRCIATLEAAKVTIDSI
jgi:FlaA1/EpsC-like NDP-sugar epimerase